MNEIQVEDRRLPAAAVIEALTPHLLEKRFERLSSVVRHRLGSVALGLEDLNHNHNGAACIRTAEGMGLQHVVAAELRQLYPLDEPLQHKITKSANSWLDLDRVDTSEALIAWAKERNMLVYGAGPRATKTIDQVPDDRPVLLLFGNEAAGLRPDTLAACDETFSIPMHGFMESFNVSVSVGMALANLLPRVRARLASEGLEGDLSPAEQERLLARWCVDDVRASAGILRRKIPSAS